MTTGHAGRNAPSSSPAGEKRPAEAAAAHAPRSTDQALTWLQRLSDETGPPSSDAGTFRWLQQAAGNRTAVSALTRPDTAGLVVGSVGDRHEREADRVADAAVGRLYRADPTAPALLAPDASEHAGPNSPAVSRQARGGEPNGGEPRGVGPEGGALDTHLADSIRAEQGRGPGLPVPLRERMETAFGADFGHVRLHNDSRADALSRSVNARAFTTGSDIFLRRGEAGSGSPEGDRLLAHELAHVVQQSDGAGPAPVRRNYAALSAMGKAQVDQQVNKDYSVGAERFEGGMAPLIEKDANVNTAIDGIIARLKAIVDAWVVHTGKPQADTYRDEFSWADGDAYYGAFEMSGANVLAVFTDTTKPLRVKLKLLYNAVRNNNLQKYLKVAALELDRTARGKAAKDRKIKTATGATKAGGKWRKNDLTKEQVTTGFAGASGLNTLSAQQVTGFSGAARGERATTGIRSKRDVFGHDRFSAIANFSDPVAATASSRRGGANYDVAMAKQRSLKVGQVDDLTDEEASWALQQKNGVAPTPLELTAFKTDPNAKIDWQQGGEYYDVIPDSEVDRAANAIKMRLEAGVSGSTDLMLHAVQNLAIGADANLMKTLRLALAGWMMANRDHSFYEVLKAAEAYNVPFNALPLAPGTAYEDAQNLYPMVKADFKDILPKWQGHDVFPATYLTAGYKDALATGLAAPDKTAAAFKREARMQGISVETVDQLDERERAELSALGAEVSAATFEIDADQRARNFAVRRLKQSPPYAYLVRAKPDLAPGILQALLRAHHGGRGLLPESLKAIENLADAGVPRYVLDTLKEKDVKALEAARVAIKATPVVGGAPPNPVWAATLASWNKVPATLRNSRLGPMVRAAMIRTYHSAAALDANQLLLADAARAQAGHEQGVAKLSGPELTALKSPPKPTGAKLQQDRDFFGGTKGREMANPAHLNTKIPQYVAWEADHMSGPEKTRVTQYMLNTYAVGSAQGDAFRAAYNNDVLNLGVALQASALPLDLPHIMPEEALATSQAILGLSDKEIGAINRYTSGLYKPLVIASNALGTGDVVAGDLNNMQWNSPLSSLKYSGPLLLAVTSGLAKLPVYTSTTYRISESGGSALNKSESQRKAVAKRFKKGTIETHAYPMSTAKSIGSKFINNHYALPAFDTVYEIRKIRSGRDIQLISDQFDEEEVLFQPGCRLRVVSAHPANPTNPLDKHVWVILEEV